MYRLGIVALVAMFALNPSLAAASDASDAIAVIHKFSESANGNDREVYASYCADDVVFIDHVPPYVFRGPKACQEEWDAVGAWAEKNNLSVDGFSRLSQPAFVDVSGDRVYAVFPVTASITLHGKKEVETGDWTFVLRREVKGWRIAGLTWTTLRFAPVASHRKPSQR
jgi:ketosteroid isomerase-like protein